jgi:hypothetical protein
LKIMPEFMEQTLLLEFLELMDLFNNFREISE